MKLRFKDINIYILYFFIGIYLIKDYFIYLDLGKYRYEYFILIISYFFVVGIFVFNTVYFKIDIFHPYILASILYIGIFTIMPIVLINKGDTNCIGIDVMDGCIKTTLIYMICYMIFSFAYISTNVVNKDNKINFEVFNLNMKKKILKISLIIWTFGFLGGMILLFANGSSIMYVLTLGARGVNSENALSNIYLQAFGNFRFFMVIPLIYILFLGKSKFLKIILLYLTSMVYLSTGFRFAMVILIVSIFTFYYKSKEKKPSIFMCIIILVIFLLFISVMGYIRSDLRSGKEISLDNFSMQEVEYALKTNFNIYQPLYGIVQKYPSEYDYTYGRATILETITMFVPRIIWNEKPLATESSVAMAMRRSVSDDVIFKAHMAIPNIGEVYVDFGIVGCIVYMFFLGRILKKSINLYHSGNIHKLIVYSVLLPTYMQIIIRGNTPSNFYLVIFLLLPALIIKTYISNGKQYDETCTDRNLVIQKINKTN